MMRRRDIILGGLGVGAFATAEALRPRKRLVLLKGTIEQTIPLAFAGWRSQTSDDLVSPAQAGKLAQSLYSETVSRVYSDGTGPDVMVLAAYGDTQSDLLQLHRPESCYPAVGYALKLARSVEVPLPGGANLPARQVVAAMEGRTENITYWTRMGETLPRTGSEQRMARIQNAVHGFVPDGILMRCSVVSDDSDGAFRTLDRFVGDLLRATAKDRRPALIGSDLATRLA